ncbi:MAG: 30S ribosomal protein S3 [Desulfurococcales archaeon]|nr:30S ribosomal protein S3 [Desulfurococcales archaeon]NAZ14405.1 30S ribosomal protein S3 [Desulfurococcales archaeon]
MVSKKKIFLENAMTRLMIEEYLASMFPRAEFAGVELIKSPLGVRVIIYADRPSLIIGRKGETIRKLQTIFEKHFKLENPQITVSSIENPELNARVVASRIAQALEKGYHYRRAMFIALRRIMAAGAVGAEIVVSGKLISERARFEKLRAGKVYKTGDHVNYIVDRATYTALLIPGIYGIEVIIVKPVPPADHIEIVQRPLEELKKIVEEYEKRSAGEEVVTEFTKEVSRETGGEK